MYSDSVLSIATKQISVNEKLKGWDEEYWHDQYIDSLKENNSDETSQSNIPDFLK